MPKRKTTALLYYGYVYTADRTENVQTQTFARTFINYAAKRCNKSATIIENEKNDKKRAFLLCSALSNTA